MKPTSSWLWSPLLPLRKNRARKDFDRIKTVQGLGGSLRPHLADSDNQDIGVIYVSIETVEDLLEFNIPLEALDQSHQDRRRGI